MVTYIISRVLTLVQGRLTAVACRCDRLYAEVLAAAPIAREDGS